MNKGGKREGSGRKSIQGKEVKLKLPFCTNPGQIIIHFAHIFSSI